MGIFTIALFIFSKNPKNISNLLFGLLCLTLIGWTTASFFSVQLHNPARIYDSIRTVFFFVILQNTLFLIFSNVFPSSFQYLRSKKVRLYIVLSILLAVGALFGLLFKSFDYSNHKVNLQPSPFIALFMLHAVLSIVLGIRKFIRRYRSASGVLKNQLLFMTIASLMLFILVPLTNFILPLAFKINSFVAFSPLYTLGFTIIIGYTIVKQKLFDIRLVVATSVAYLLSLATLAAIYGSVVFAVSQVVFGANHQSTFLSQLITVIFVVILTFIFQPIKAFFDQITNSIFYRDAYDSQVVLNNINTLLTQEILLKKITTTSLRIICENLKISKGYFAVVDGGKIYHSAIYGMDEAPQIPMDDLKSLTKNITLADDLLRGHSKEMLDRHDFNVGLRIVTQDGVVGYILLSQKQSGNIYVDQDIRLLNIITNELAIAVQNARAFEEIQQFNLTLREKVEEATKELRRANVKLKELDATKDEFISMASHQLRTPLTTIKGYLSMILEGDVGKDKKEEKQMLQQAFDSAQNMVDLIADLLNVSRLQSGKFVIENKPTDLAEMIDKEIGKLREQAATRNLKLSYDKPASIPILSLDATKMRQVVMNFIDNAIYYTPPGGSIEVALEASKHTITYTVKDTGLGVPKNVQHHLFSKFYRAGNAKKMRPDGTGLGLYMAKKVVVAQGGAIIFKSEEGKGSTFGFSFPRSKIEVKA